MVAKEKWVVAGVALIAISIWGVLLMTIFSSPDEPDTMTGPETSNNGLAQTYEETLGGQETFPSSTAENESVLNEPDDNETPQSPIEDVDQNEDMDRSTNGDLLSPKGALMRERGILPGDFEDIAPDGVASVDDVLERVLEEDDELE